MKRLVLSCALFIHLAFAQGVITTVAGTDFALSPAPLPALDAPTGIVYGVVFGDNGNFYFSDAGNQRIFKVDSKGTLEIFAGNGIAGFSGDGGPAVNASLNFPGGLTLDSTGNLFFADTYNNRIRKVTPGGIISTVAGTGIAGMALGDGGLAINASLNRPQSVVVDATNSLYVADTFNQRIRKVTSDGRISTIFSGALGTEPFGVAVDKLGNLFVADLSVGLFKVSPSGAASFIAGGQPISAVTVDSAGNLFFAETARIRKVSAAGVVSTIAGNGTVGFSGDGGSAVEASIAFPTGIALDSRGNIVIADTRNQRIREVSANGALSTIAGNGSFGFAGDGGPATSAALAFPRGVAVDREGNLFIADYNNGRIRKVTTDGVISTVAGNGRVGFSGDGGPATDASLTSPVAITVDPEGNLLIADTQNQRIRRISRSGIISTIAGNGAEGFSGDGGLATSASLDFPEGLALDRASNLFFADFFNRRVRKITAEGIITTVAGNGKVGFSGDAGPAIQAAIGPRDVLVDGAGDLLVADSANNRIRMIRPNGIITTVAGNGVAGSSGDGGLAVNASLNAPSSLAMDRDGSLFVADSGNNRIRRISASGIISTVAGNGIEAFSGDGGLATDASLAFPRDIALDGNGNLLISEFHSNRIRMVLASPPSIGANPQSLTFLGQSGGKISPSQTITITSSIPSVSFNVSVSTRDGENWLATGISVGATPRIIEITANPFSLAPGTYSGMVTIQASLGRPNAIRISISLTVTPGVSPLLVIDRDHLSFTYARTSTTRGQNLTVSNRGGGPLPFTTSVLLDSGREANWLRVTPATGTATPSAPAALTIQADPTRLPAGTYTGRIVITGSVAGSGSASIPVTMTITTNPLILLLSQTGLTFTAVQSGGVIPSQTFAVLNLGSGLLNWRVQTSTLSGGNWLIATPNSGSSDAASASSAPLVTVSVNPAGLKPDVYYGLVKVVSTGAANTPQEVVVVLECLPAGTDVAAIVKPNALIFTGPAGKSSPSSQDVLVYDPTGTRKSFRSGRTTVDGVNWLATLPTDATIAPDQPTRIVVQPLVDNLTPGTYHGTLTLQFSDGRVSTVAITFVVTGAGPTGGTSAEQGRDGMQRTVNSCTPKQLLPALISLGSGFTVPAGYPQGLEAQVVDDCGNMHQAGKVVVEFSNGDPPVKLSSLNNGRWDGTWKTGIQQLSNVTLTVTAENPALQIKGQNQITGGLGTPRAAPVVADNGVVSAASLVQQAPLAPGGLISIFGQRLSEGTSQAPPVSTELASTTVTIGDQQLPLLYASDGQVNAVVPFGVNVNTNQQLLVQRGSTYAQPIYVDIAGAQPAIFQSGQQGIIVDVKNNLIGPSNPAHAGDVVVIYCSGLGAVNPPVMDGAITPGSPLSSTVNPVRVAIGGQNAPVLFAGLTPGLVGLYQVNATLPQGVAPGDEVPVSLIVNDQSSPIVSTSVR